ncbi:hypothetical protein ACJIZ3_000103 [Penstemon smallii]|uniref:Uncharacterized protein n=1 Tax=Penstemon smallii TaxID=265156 RepID=A0ABD3R6Q0_9LAMI
MILNRERLNTSKIRRNIPSSLNPRPRCERGFTIFSFRKPSDHVLRIKQSIKSLFPLLLAGNHSAIFLFVDQATPGFELGKKDLQSPALPLGHAAKMIQNR